MENIDKLFTWCQGPQSDHLKSILFRYDEPAEHISEFVVR
jgi:hypothetical protein